MLNEPDADLATAIMVSDEAPDNKMIRLVYLTNVWTDFKEELAIMMYSNYQTRLMD